MKLGNAIAEIMKSEGIEILCAYPVNTLIECAAAADIRPVIVRQERTGLHMADAISRVTSGKTIGVFCMQHGPGAQNSFGGGAQCFAESVPVLVPPWVHPAVLHTSLLGGFGMRASMSRKGNCCDNAPMESFWDMLKNEQIHHCRYATRQEAIQDITGYIEIFYNQQRKQARLRFLSPAAYERWFYEKRRAA